MTDSWLHCNDAKMKMVDLSEVYNAQAYILVYTMSPPTHPPPPSPSSLLVFPSLPTATTGPVTPSNSETNSIQAEPGEEVNTPPFTDESIQSNLFAEEEEAESTSSTISYTEEMEERLGEIEEGVEEVDEVSFKCTRRSSPRRTLTVLSPDTVLCSLPLAPLSLSNTLPPASSLIGPSKIPSSLIGPSKIPSSLIGPSKILSSLIGPSKRTNHFPRFSELQTTLTNNGQTWKRRKTTVW